LRTQMTFLLASWSRCSKRISWVIGRAALRRTAGRLRPLPLVPASGYLERLGAEVRTAEAVAWIDASQELLRIGLASGAEIAADALVLASDPATLRRLALEFGLGNGAWRQQVAATRHAPPFAVWQPWLDRPVASDRAAFLGTSGFGPLNNISVLECFEEGRAGRRLAAAQLSSCTRTH
jgi:carotenoid phi-ring synthase / carotenoid chi-ring synthase